MSEQRELTPAEAGVLCERHRLITTPLLNGTWRCKEPTGHHTMIRPTYTGAVQAVCEAAGLDVEVTVGDLQPGSGPPPSWGDVYGLAHAMGVTLCGFATFAVLHNAWDAKCAANTQLHAERNGADARSRALFTENTTLHAENAELRGNNERQAEVIIGYADQIINLRAENELLRTSNTELLGNNERQVIDRRHSAILRLSRERDEATANADELRGNNERQAVLIDGYAQTISGLRADLAKQQEAGLYCATEARNAGEENARLLAANVSLQGRVEQLRADLAQQSDLLAQYNRRVEKLQDRLVRIADLLPQTANNTLEGNLAALLAVNAALRATDRADPRASEIQTWARRTHRTVTCDGLNTGAFAWTTHGLSGSRDNTALSGPSVSAAVDAYEARDTHACPAGGECPKCDAPQAADRADPSAADMQAWCKAQESTTTYHKGGDVPYVEIHIAAGSVHIAGPTEQCERPTASAAMAAYEQQAKPGADPRDVVCMRWWRASPLGHSGLSEWLATPGARLAAEELDREWNAQ